jgi:hypothetical protein
MSVIIYVLRLEHSCWYVGRTQHLNRRLAQHLDKTDSSIWTQMHPMIEVREAFEGEVFDEDKTVLKYMDKYGIDQVRGGSFSKTELPQDTYVYILKQLRHARNECMRCGLIGHNITDCNVVICFRCGRIHHNVSNCTKTNHVYGWSLKNCKRCGRNHQGYCTYATDIFGKQLYRKGDCFMKYVNYNVYKNSNKIHQPIITNFFHRIQS